MDEETRIALDNWVQTVDKMLRQHSDILSQISGHITDHQVDITAIQSDIDHIQHYLDMNNAKGTRIQNMERRIEHIERSLSESKWMAIDLADPMKDFTERPVIAVKGSEDTDV